MSADADVLRPAPIVTEDSLAFWQAAAEGRLVAQQCAGCGRLRHPPRPLCPSCHSTEQTMVDLAGTGVVYSYSVLHHPQNPAFTYPVLAVLVELDEGVRILSNLVGTDPGSVSIGLPVEVRFEPTADGKAVPIFVPREVDP
jgi:uncharacterized OB-fold protein